MTDQFPADRDLPEGRHAARRAHLLAAMEQAPARRPFRPRLVLLAGVAGVAAATAAALVLVPSGEPDAPDGPNVAPVSAVTVLTRAADAAAAQPDLKPSANQYVHVESRSRQPTDGDPSAVRKGAKTIVKHRKVWLPIDGKRAGLLVTVENGRTSQMWLCDSWQRADKSDIHKVDLRRPPGPCKNMPVHHGGLPTKTDAMRSWLYRNSRGGNPPDVQAFITIGDTLREAYVPPAALAAMFRAAKTIPGVTVRPNVVDLAGHRGVAVGQTWNGTRHDLIFDARTYRLLGERTTVDRDASFQPKGGSTPKPSSDPTKSLAPTPGASTDPYPGLKDGFVLYETTILKSTVVDRLGQTSR